MIFMNNNIIIFLLFFFFPVGIPAIEKNPENVKIETLSDEREKSYPLPHNFYQKHISPVDGERCQMYPSCSAYSKDAIKKHGYFIGWIMTCDRLLRCGMDESRLSKPVYLNGNKYVYDPVKNNDFWWGKR